MPIFCVKKYNYLMCEKKFWSGEQVQTPPTPTPS